MSSEWQSNVRRDTIAAMVSKPYLMTYNGIALGQCNGRTRYEFLSVLSLLVSLNTYHRKCFHLAAFPLSTTKILTMTKLRFCHNLIMIF